MAYKLFLKPITLPAALGEEAAGLSAEPLFNWVLTDATGERIADGAALSVQGIATVLQQQNVSQASVIGVIPAERVFTAEVAVPAKQQRYVAQALPFAVEELLAEDLEEVHLVPGKKNKNGKYPVAVINKAYFSTVLDTLKSSNLVLDQAIVEGDMVPWQDGTVSVILDD
ncbi:MAG: type II secretion system protein GspL [Pseudomonadales bacterium]|nr:type II secretion system protein GspL [Pseudomonadales bacterium]